MGRWSGFTSVHVNSSQLSDAISDILKEYGESVFTATEEGLDAAEAILVRNLKQATPGKPPHKRNFAKNWKGTGRKYKLLRFVGNTTTVPGKSGDIALANIFEYSTTRGNPFVAATFGESIDEMAAAVVAKVKEV